MELNAKLQNNIASNIGTSNDVSGTNVGQTDAVQKSRSNEKVVEVKTEELKGNKELTEADIKKAVEKMNKLLQGEATHAEYEKHEKLNAYVIKIVENDTGKVINEIPPKKILDLVAKLCELAGVFVNKKA